MGWKTRLAFWFVMSVFVFGHVNIFDRWLVFGEPDEQGFRFVWDPDTLPYIFVFTVFMTMFDKFTGL